MNVINIYKWILIAVTIFIIWCNAVVKDDYKTSWKVNLLFLMYLLYLVIS